MSGSADRSWLHFTLGPVQGFVSQARRTRDLWAGSFLLSFLSAHAMAAVLDPKGEGSPGRILRPAVDLTGNGAEDDLIAAVLATRRGEQPKGTPAIGSLPNAFKAEVPAAFDPASCEASLRAAWERVTAAVWDRYVTQVAELGAGTAEIWHRQVSSFWETAWVQVSSDAARDDPWLARRKNWRTHLPPVEPGDKCTLFGDLQELSGHHRSQARGAQDRFWNSLRDAPGFYDLDLSDGERLSAIALIKRLFPRVSREALGWELDAVASWPSTSALATRPWVARAQSETPEAAASFASICLEVLGRGAFTEPGTAGQPDAFGRVDARLYFKDRLTSATLPEAGKSGLRALEESLERLYAHVGPPSAYYGLLMLDGDQLGRLLSTAGEATLSRALGAFTRTVPGTIAAAGGVTVYAGGDDVLALLPLPSAVRTSAALRASYGAAFQGLSEATASASLLLVSDGVPLRSALELGRQALEADAKDGNGRDSVVIRTVDSHLGGVCWVTTWFDRQGESVTSALEQLTDRLSAASGDLARSFPHKLEERYAAVRGSVTGTLDLDIQTAELGKVVGAELAKSNRDESYDDETDEKNRQLGELIVYLGTRRQRAIVNGAPHVVEDPRYLDPAPGLLARFLSRETRGGPR